MTTSAELILASGTWTDPESGLVFEEHLNAVKLEEYMEWLPGFIAVINSGAYDKYIYEIAKACHVRHLATKGEATSLRPAAPEENGPTITDELPLRDIPENSRIYARSIQQVPVAFGLKTFTYRGRTYPKGRVLARCFQAMDSFNDALRGTWLRVDDFGADHFKCRIVTEPLDARVSVGQMITVNFSDVDHLFA